MDHKYHRQNTAATLRPKLDQAARCIEVLQSLSPRYHILFPKPISPFASHHQGLSMADRPHFDARSSQANQNPSDASADGPNDCVICGSKPTQLCARCRSSSYCSKECQAADWLCHKLLCKKYAEKPPRPSKNHRLGIEFPEDDAVPRLTWVYCEERFDEDEEVKYEAPNMRPFFGEGSWSGPRPRLIRRNLRLDRAFSDAIELTSRDAFLIDGSKPNQAVYASASAGSIGSVPGDWRGPIVVLRAQGLSIDPNTYTDVTLDDFRHLMDYFIRYRE